MPTVTITSPADNATVGTDFTVTGTVTGLTGPIPDPPPLDVLIEIGGGKVQATSVSMNDSGGFTATFENVPAGTDATIRATWVPTGDFDTVDGITVK